MTCNDCIHIDVCYRQGAVDINYANKCIDYCQTQKYGKWIDYSDEGFVECPFCGHATNCEDNINELHYCFYCGAKMKSEEEYDEFEP